MPNCTRIPRPSLAAQPYASLPPTPVGLAQRVQGCRYRNALLEGQARYQYAGLCGTLRVPLRRPLLGAPQHVADQARVRPPSRRLELPAPLPARHARMRRANGACPGRAASGQANSRARQPYVVVGPRVSGAHKPRFSPVRMGLYRIVRTASRERLFHDVGCIKALAKV
jgi:hypothetical protein